MRIKRDETHLHKVYGKDGAWCTLSIIKLLVMLMTNMKMPLVPSDWKIFIDASSV